MVSLSFFTAPYSPSHTILHTVELFLDSRRNQNIQQIRGNSPVNDPPEPLLLHSRLDIIRNHCWKSGSVGTLHHGHHTSYRLLSKLNALPPELLPRLLRHWGRHADTYVRRRFRPYNYAVSPKSRPTVASKKCNWNKVSRN